MGETPAYQRRLSTIVAIDICGYSKLVEQDEDSAIRVVDATRKIISDVIVTHGGRIFNHAGDGVMAETASAIEGVRAAFEIHRELKAFNDRRPDASPITVRIGVNLGDVVAKDDGDLVGHGVNIAARLESIAAPGETVISHAVYEQIRGTVEELFQSTGYEKLKNIDSPIEVYRAVKDGGGKPRIVGPKSTRRISLPWGIAAIAAAFLVVFGLFTVLSGPEKPKYDDTHQVVAVAPFNNIGTDDENSYFAEGITTELLAALVRVDDLTVLGPESSFSLVGGGSAAEARSRLGATHLLEGSVQRAGDRVRIVARLVDVRSGAHVWSETYARELNDIFALQEDIAGSIAAALEVTFEPSASSQVRQVDPDVYEIYLRARDLLRQRGMALPQAVALFQTAVARDPDFAEAWAGLASASHVLPAYTDTPYEDVAELVREAAMQALRVNPGSAEALGVLAAQDRKRGRWLKAEQGFQKALSLEPNNISVIYYYGEFLLSVGRFDDAKVMFDQAFENDPLSPFTSTGVGWAAYFAGDQDAAEQAFRRVWDEYGMKLPQVWEGLFTLMLDREDFTAADAFVEYWPGDADAKPLYRAFIAALKAPDVAIPVVVRQFAELEATMAVPYYWKYEALMRLGQTDLALDLVSRAVDAGPLETTQPLFSPSATAAWEHEQFEDVTQGLGLTSYWLEADRPDICDKIVRTASFCQ